VGGRLVTFDVNDAALFNRRVCCSGNCRNEDIFAVVETSLKGQAGALATDGQYRGARTGTGNKQSRTRRANRGASEAPGGLSMTMRKGKFENAQRH